MKKLIKDTEDWANDVGIYRSSTVRDQIEKLAEEVCELTEECVKNHGTAAFKLELGDCLVCLINAAYLANTSIDECLAMTLNKITARQGMMVDGKFVKH